MPVYQSPGVYVEEVPSAVQPIAGVGTSTAAFIGLAPVYLPILKDRVKGEVVGTGNGTTKVFDLSHHPVHAEAGFFEARVGGQPAVAELVETADGDTSQVVFKNAPGNNKAIEVDYCTVLRFLHDVRPVPRRWVAGEEIATGDGQAKTFSLAGYPVHEEEMIAGFATYKFEVGHKLDDGTVTNLSEVTGGATLSQDQESGIWSVTVGSLEEGQTLFYSYLELEAAEPAAAGAGVEEVKLCTNFGEFKELFGGFSLDPRQRNLAHAVYGFFANGGTRCFVVRITADTDLDAALGKLAAIDEPAIVAAPGFTNSALLDKLTSHCKVATKDRFAIFDCPLAVEDAGGRFDTAKLDPKSPASVLPGRTDYAAYYFPWIRVFDPVANLQYPAGGGLRWVPPSGHVAGVYARVDTSRGVHKAPANEVVRGARELRYPLSRAHQEGLNPQGINCIRELNGNIRIWGARTLGGDANGEWRYVNVRRLFLFLRESIDEGTQWVVFEPNDPALWAKITRNVTAFLTNVWRDGALFGATPEEAFYVKCDAETNPPSLRDLGQVVTEIGVAVVKPAEFVVFEISQWAGPGG